jgi:hypothetical protein
MTEAKVTIGHIAHAAGVNVETVRYYQRRGLVFYQRARIACAIACRIQLALPVSSTSLSSAKTRSGRDSRRDAK